MTNYEHTYSYTTNTSNMNLGNWADIFLSIFRDMNTAILQPPDGSTSNRNVDAYKHVIEDGTSYDYYEWSVLFQDTDVNSPIHFKLTNENIIEDGTTVNNDVRNASIKLWMAYHNSEYSLSWIPILHIPPVTTSGSNWGENTTTKQYHSIHTIETEYGDIFIQGFIQWLKYVNDGYQVDEGSIGPGGSVYLPLFALVHGANRTNSSDITMLCLGFTAPRAMGGGSGSKKYLQTYDLPMFGKYESVQNAISSAGIIMYPTRFVAPDVAIDTSIGIKIPLNLCLTAVPGLDSSTSDNLSTSDSVCNYWRLPVYPGPIQGVYHNGITSPNIKTQLMIPVVNPYSYYIPQYCGLLLMSDVWKRGTGTFNGKQYVFINNFAMRLNKE